MPLEQATLVGAGKPYGKNPEKQFVTCFFLKPGNPGEGMQAGATQFMLAVNFHPGKEPEKFPRPCVLDIQTDLNRQSAQVVGIRCE